MKRKFTLIEILGVTILISILAAIGIAAYSYAMESSKESATRALITRINTAFEELQQAGLMLKTDTGNGTEFVMLVFNPDPATVNDSDDADGFRIGDDSKTVVFGNNAKNKQLAYKIFAKAIGADSIKRNLNSDNQLIDNWGNPIYVRFPGKFNRGGFDIISTGNDGLFADEEEKIDTFKDFNKKIKDTSKPLELFRDKEDNEWLCDDITNF